MLLRLKPYPIPILLPIAARGPVCVCGHPDHWEHCNCHHSAAVHVRLHWGPALQGKVPPPSPLISIPGKGAKDARGDSSLGQVYRTVWPETTTCQTWDTVTSDDNLSIRPEAPWPLPTTYLSFLDLESRGKPALPLPAKGPCVLCYASPPLHHPARGLAGLFFSASISLGLLVSHLKHSLCPSPSTI